MLSLLVTKAMLTLLSLRQSNACLRSCGRHTGKARRAKVSCIFQATEEWQLLFTMSHAKRAEIGASAVLRKLQMEPVGTRLKPGEICAVLFARHGRAPAHAIAFTISFLGE